MRKIAGNYLHHGKVKDFEFNLPNTWEELDSLQSATILQVLSFQKADPFTIKVSVLLLASGHKNSIHILALSTEDQHALVQEVNWVLETRPPAINKFPELKINRNIHIAPAHDLSNLSFGEWCFAYEFYKLFGQTSDKQYLDKLIATIYRKPIPDLTDESQEYNGDLRMLFNENLIDKTAKGVSAIQESWKMAVLTWFTSSLLELMDRREHVFPKNSTDETSGADEASSDQRTWLTVFRELLGPKFGTSEQLKHTNAMFVLDYLEDQHIAYEEAKASMKA